MKKRIVIVTFLFFFLNNFSIVANAQNVKYFALTTSWQLESFDASGQKIETKILNRQSGGQPLSMAFGDIICNNRGWELVVLRDDNTLEIYPDPRVVSAEIDLLQTNKLGSTDIYNRKAKSITIGDIVWSDIGNEIIVLTDYSQSGQIQFYSEPDSDGQEMKRIDWQFVKTLYKDTLTKSRSCIQVCDIDIDKPGLEIVAQRDTERYADYYLYSSSDNPRRQAYYTTVYDAVGIEYCNNDLLALDSGKQIWSSNSQSFICNLNTSSSLVDFIAVPEMTSCQDMIGFGVFIDGDLNNDCKVDLSDVALFSEQFFLCTALGQCPDEWVYIEDNSNISIVVNDEREGWVEVQNEPNYIVTATRWGLKWNHDLEKFLGDVNYKIYVEYYVPTDFYNRIYRLHFGYYDVSAQTQDNIGSDGEAGITIQKEDVVPDSWQIAQIGNGKFGNYNGYSFVDFYPDTAAQAADLLRIRRFWAVVDSSSINDKSLAALCHSKQIRSKLDDKLLEEYATHKYENYEDIKNKFFFGAFFGSDMEGADFGLTRLEQYKLLFRNMKLNGLNAMCNNMASANSELLQAILDASSKHRIYCLAGSTGNPLANRYASPDSIVGLNFESVRSDIRSMVQNCNDYPYHIGYYLADEPKDWQTPYLYKALSIYEQNDRQRPALCMVLDVQDAYKMPLVFARPSYPFRPNYLLESNGLAKIGDWADAINSGTDNPIWACLQAWGTQESARMPTDEEMEVQTYLAFANNVMGFFYYTYYYKPKWENGQTYMVDSVMTENPIMNKVSEMDADFRGAADLASKGVYLQNPEAIFCFNTPSFDTYFTGNGSTETRPQVISGVYQYPNDLGHLLVMVNQQTGETGSVEVVSQNGALAWADTSTLTLLSSSDLNMNFNFSQGQGKLIWVGDLSKWDYVKDEILLTSTRNSCQVLRDLVNEASLYGLSLPDMSFVDGGQWQQANKPGYELSLLYNDALNQYETAIEGTDYSAVNSIITDMQSQLSQLINELEVRPATSPPEQSRESLYQAISDYYDLTLLHINSGTTVSNAISIKNSIEYSISQIRILEGL